MDRLISEKEVLNTINAWFYELSEQNISTLQGTIKAIPSAEPIYYPPCEDCHKKMNEIRKAYDKIQSAEPEWIPVSERLPEEDGDYFVTYEKGYAEDYNFIPIGIVRFEVDCESFGYWHEYFDGQTMGSLGSEWEEIKVIAWMPLPQPYKAESEDKERSE